MGKRYVDHESTLDTPINKRRKTESSHQQFAEHSTEEIKQIDAVAAADVTYSLTTDLVDGVILTDLCAKKWRCGKPIGKCFFPKKKKSDYFITIYSFCRQRQLWRNFSGL